MRSRQQWGTLDFLVHAIAFSDKSELKGRYADSTRENFIRTMVISCYAFTEAAKRAAALMPNGGAMVTLTYNGGDRAMPNYNVMGVAKAGLEASVRYLAVDFGHQKIRVNAISAGPIRTLAGAGITDARYMFAFQQKYSPLGRGVTLEELGGAGLYLLVGSVDRRHRRSSFRRLRLQRHRHAAARRAEGSGRRGGERRVSSHLLSSPRRRGPMTPCSLSIQRALRSRRDDSMRQIKNGRGNPRPFAVWCLRPLSLSRSAEIRQGRSDRRSSPWSRPPRSPSRTSPSSPRRHRLPRRRAAASASRRSDRRGWPVHFSSLRLAVAALVHAVGRRAPIACPCRAG